MSTQVYSFTPADANLTGFASNVTGATWTLTANEATDGLAHQVSVRNDSSNDKSSIDITLVGTGPDGQAQTETITGPGASATVESTLYYLTLTSVTPASTWGADTADIGWVDEVMSQTIGLNARSSNAATLNVDIGGTINYTVNQTFDNIGSNGYDPSGTTWQAITALSAKTADVLSASTVGATAVQFVVNSYSSGATARMDLAQPWSYVRA